MQAKTNEKSNTFTVKLPLPKQITRGPLRMDAQVLGSIAVVYLSALPEIRDKMAVARAH